MAAAPSDAELARIHERQRLAVELHASVAQSLFAIGVEAGLGLDTADATARGNALREIASLVGDARRELHATLTRLDRVPDDRPLPDRLDEAVDAFSRTSGVAVRLAVSGVVRTIDDERDELLLDTLDEALRNARKHTPVGTYGVRRIDAALSYGDAGVRLRVRNDGAARAVRPDPDRAADAGCLGRLTARATRLGGRLDLELAPAERDGAVLRLDLPITTTEEGTT